MSLTDFRCTKCGRLLARTAIEEGIVAIVCPRCNVHSTLRATSPNL